jgi:hypothetical protein
LILNGVTGAITGTPTAPGTFNFSITATDATGCTGSRLYTMTIASPGCPAITVSPSTLPPGNAQMQYSQTVSASGGTAPYTFTVSAGSLPNGLTLNPATGLISGIPQQSGLSNFTIQATDSVGCIGNRTYLFAVTPFVPANGPTLDPVGLAILMILLIGAGLFVINKTS